MISDNTKGAALKQFRHLPYLDGLRGLAAFYVVLHHAYMEIIESPTRYAQLPTLIGHATKWLFYGQVAVDIFIVLSGYCLMLPIALSGGSLRGGFHNYLLRRSRRVLPPYYIALGLSLLLICIVPNLNTINNIRWDVALPALTPGSIISHLFLLHNIRNSWVHAINPPMWSVATEWQIYFLFPIFLLPVWRKFGNITTILLSFFFGLAPHFLLHNGDQACPWFLGLFALGMTAADISVSSLASFNQILKWSTVFGVFTTTIFIGLVYKHTEWLWSNHLYLMDIVVGLAVSCFLVYCTNYCYNCKESLYPFILKFMASKYPVLLGTFSYSLYLVHFPVLSLLHTWILPLGLTPTTALIFFLTIGTITSLIVSYIFHLLFERKFIKIHLKN